MILVNNLKKLALAFGDVLFVTLVLYFGTIFFLILALNQKFLGRDDKVLEEELSFFQDRIERLPDLFREFFYGSKEKGGGFFGELS